MAGAQAIAQVLKKTQITQLNLRENNIGDAGAQAIAQVLASNPDHTIKP